MKLYKSDLIAFLIGAGLTWFTLIILKGYVVDIVACSIAVVFIIIALYMLWQQ